MEYQFSTQSYNCLHTALWEEKTEELTQEYRLSDGMPDIGRVIGTWGQVMIRSKEWQDDKVLVSGGVTVWAMYEPEEGGTSQSVEVWLPMRMQWSLPDGCPEGSLIVSCKIKSVDARSVSARRMILRSVVSVHAEGLVPQQVEIYEPCELPADMQLLTKEYPVRMTKETGEKPFLLDEELSLTADGDNAGKLIRCYVQPEIIEKKIVGDKAVFRGVMILDLLFQCDNAEPVKQSFDIPFSQYVELSREYGSGASVSIQLAQTSMEPDLLEDGSMRIKIGMLCQYAVDDAQMVCIVQDAYSPKREIELHFQQLEMPAILEERQERIKAEQAIDGINMLPMDMGLLIENPVTYHDFGSVSLGLSGTFRYMSKDQNGILQSVSAPWKQTMDYESDRDVCVRVRAGLTGKPQMMQSADGLSLKQDVLLEMKFLSAQPMQMLCGISAGDITENNDRPSLILCRAGQKSLWELAKENNSTIDAICRLNELTGEPAEDVMLLIPVEA